MGFTSEGYSVVRLVQALSCLSWLDGAGEGSAAQWWEPPRTKGLRTGSRHLGGPLNSYPVDGASAMLCVCVGPDQKTLVPVPQFNSTSVIAAIFIGVLTYIYTSWPLYSPDTFHRQHGQLYCCRYCPICCRPECSGSSANLAWLLATASLLLTVVAAGMLLFSCNPRPWPS